MLVWEGINGVASANVKSSQPTVVCLQDVDSLVSWTMKCVLVPLTDL